MVTDAESWTGGGHAQSSPVLYICSEQALDSQLKENVLNVNSA